MNERDGLGDETPPDYLTAVHDGGFYGWPYCYWGQTVDDRVPQNAALMAQAIQPDYALGGHTASLGLCWMPAGTLPGFPDGMAIGQHGSWNRSTLSGYRVVFVPFEDGRPSGPARDILSGFLAPDEKVSYGRPVGVTVGPDAVLVAGGRRRRRCHLASDRTLKAWGPFPVLFAACKPATPARIGRDPPSWRTPNIAAKSPLETATSPTRSSSIKIIDHGEGFHHRDHRPGWRVLGGVPVEQGIRGPWPRSPVQHGRRQ